MLSISVLTRPIKTTWIPVGLTAIALFARTWLAAPDEIRPFTDLQVQAISHHRVHVRACALPPGGFEELTMPRRGSPFFGFGDVGHPEYLVPLPARFENLQDVDEEGWVVRAVPAKGGRMIYELYNTLGTEAFRIDLPEIDGKYDFFVLRNLVGDALVGFMNADDEDARDGLFGYITVEEPSHWGVPRRQ